MKTILITKRTLSDLSLKRYYEDLEFETIKYERMVVYRSLDKRKWTWWLTLHYNHLTSNAFRTVRFWVQIYLTSSDKCIPEKRIQYKISNCTLLNEKSIYFKSILIDIGYILFYLKNMRTNFHLIKINWFSVWPHGILILRLWLFNSGSRKVYKFMEEINPIPLRMKSHIRFNILREYDCWRTVKISL